MSEPLTTTLEGLPNAETGAAPNLRFINTTHKNDGEALHTAYSDMATCSSMKDFERAEIESMMAHTPPYSVSQLKELNMENYPNSTRGELPRRVNTQASTWMDFAAGNSGLWKITFNNAPGEIKEDVESQAAECLNATWGNFPQHTTLMLKAFKEHSKYGFGPVVWSDCYDPSPCAKMAWELKFPRRTEIDWSNLTEYGMADNITLKELYEAMKQDKLRKGSGTGGGRAMGGWQEDEIMKLLKHVATTSGAGEFNYDSLEAMMLAESNGTNLWGKGSSFRGSAEVVVVRMWVQEYEEDAEGYSISFYTLAQVSDWRIIQSRPRHFVDWSAALTAAVDGSGLDGTISGLRGLGLDIRPACRDMDILECARNWAANHRMTPHYTTTSASVTDIAERMVVRPNGVMVGQGITEFESTVDWKAGEEVLISMSNQLDTVQNVYAINAPNHGGVQRTAAEAKQDAFKEQDARLAQILPMSKLFIVPLGREFARRLVMFPRTEKGEILKYPGWKTAKFFWDKVNSYPLLAQTLDMLTPSAEISVNPDATPDGLDKKLMKSELGLNMLPLLATQAQRDIVINSRLVGIYGHKAAVPIMNVTDKPMDTNNAAFIDAENADMLSGRPRRVFPEQDHFQHLGPLDMNGEGHCTAIMRELQEIQSGLQDQFATDPEATTAERIKSGLSFKAHLDAHIMLASQNPALMDGEEIQGYYDFSTQLEQVLKQTISNFQKAMEAKAQESGQQMDPKAQAILMKAEAEIEAGNKKLAAEIQREEIRSLNKLGNMEQTSQARRDEKKTDYVLNKSMQLDLERLKLQGMALDARVRAVNDMADAQKDLNKEKKEADKLEAQKATAAAAP